MSRLKVFCLALLSVLVVGVMTAAGASAESSPLPDIHTALPGENYPLNLGGRQTSANSIQNSGGGILHGTDFSVLLSAKELTSLGPAFIEFLGVEEVKEAHKCHTAGASEPEGEVIIPNGEFHLVYTSLSPSEPLELGALVLFTKFAITCNAGLFEITVTNPSMVRVNVPKPTLAEGDSTDIEVASHCIAPGVQEIPYYYDDTLTRVATTLLSSVSGAANKPSCEEIAGTILLTPETGSAASMFSVLY